MGIIKSEDIIAWQEEKGADILCDQCCGENDTPLTSYDLEEDDVVVCDRCHERIQ